MKGSVPEFAEKLPQTVPRDAGGVRGLYSVP